MNKLNSFVNSFIAIVTGDNAQAKAEKGWRQADSAFKIQIAALNGDLVTKEDAVTQAQESLAKKLVNSGNEITDRTQYIASLISAKETLKQAEKQLAAHKETIDFLEEQYALLKAE